MSECLTTNQPCITATGATPKQLMNTARISEQPASELRSQYYRRLSPILAGEQFKIAIEKIEGFSFAHPENFPVSRRQIKRPVSRSKADTAPGLKTDTNNLSFAITGFGRVLPGGSTANFTSGNSVCQTVTSSKVRVRGSSARVIAHSLAQTCTSLYEKSRL